MHIYVKKAIHKYVDMVPRKAVFAVQMEYTHTHSNIYIFNIYNKANIYVYSIANKLHSFL